MTDDIYRYRANAALVGGVRAALYAVVGPAICQLCRRHVYYAHSRTRVGWNGPEIRGRLAWRDATGRRHVC